MKKNVAQIVLLLVYIYERFDIYLAFCIYIMCTLSFADGSHCYLHLKTKIFCFGETFLYTQKALEIVPNSKIRYQSIVIKTTNIYTRLTEVMIIWNII